MAQQSGGPSPLFKGLVTHVIDPSNFYMRIGTETDLQKFMIYQQKMDEFLKVYQETPDGIECLVVGQDVMVKVDESADGVHWERARVSNVDPDANTVDVFFIDLGYTQLVEFSQVNLVVKELFDHMADQAFPCELSSIMPLSKQWTKRAISVFSSRVMDEELVISLELSQQDDGYCAVHLFKRCEENFLWESIVYLLLEEEVGISTRDLDWTQLSSEFVNATLAQTDAEKKEAQSRMSTEEDDSEDILEPTDFDISEAFNECEDIEHHSQLQIDQVQQLNIPINADLTAPQTDDLKNRNGNDLYLPSPSEFMSMSPINTSSKTITSSSIGIPKADVFNILQNTTELNLRKMNEDKVTESQKYTRHVIELEQESQEKYEDEATSSELEYGPSDSSIARGWVRPGYHDDFSAEIHQGYDRQDSTEALQPFLTGLQHKSSKAKKETDIGMTYPEKYSSMSLNDQEKEICQILSTPDRDQELLIALINSIVEPDDDDVDSERLSMVIRNVLDSVLGKPYMQSVTAFKILYIYSGHKHFERELITSLKTLKQRYVRRPQSVRLSETHSAFVTMLAELFIQIETWDFRLCKQIQDYIMSVVDGWSVFNKHRMQQVDDTELLYLECVETFVKIAHSLITKKYAQSYLALLDSVKEKLLHDNTSRVLRSHSLQLLLQLHNNGVPMLSRETTGIDKAVQTDGQAVGDLKRSSATFVSELKHDNRKPVKFYRAPRGSLNPRGDPNVPTAFDFDKDNTITEHNHDSIPSQSLSQKNIFNQGNNIKSLCHLPLQLNRENDVKISSNNSPCQTPVEEKDEQKDFMSNQDLYSNTEAKHSDVGLDHSNVTDINENQCGDFELKENGHFSIPINEKEHLKKYMFGDVNDLVINEITESISTDSFSVQQTVENKRLLNNDLASAKSERYLLSPTPKNNTDKVFLPPPPHRELDLEAIYGSNSLDMNQENNTFDNNKEHEKHQIKKIYYSPEQLKKLNPHNSANQTNGSVQKLRKYRYKWVTFLKNLPNAPDLPIKEKSPEPESKAINRYNGFNGGGDAPLFLAADGGNAKSWAKLSDLLPPSQMPRHKAALFAGTSVDPIPTPVTSVDGNDDLDKRLPSLLDGQSSIHFTGRSHDRNDVNSNNTEMEIHDQSSINCAGNSHDKNDDTEIEIWEGISTTDVETQNNNGKKGKKKKKTKFRPLTDFQMNSDRNENQSHSSLRDPYGFDDSDDNGEELDELSEEMLKYYIECEKTEISSNEVLHGPRLGGSMSTTSKPSALAQLRRTQTEISKRPNIPWEPKRQFCSKCGSEDHIVYSCPEME